MIVWRYISGSTNGKLSEFKYKENKGWIYKWNYISEKQNEHLNRTKGNGIRITRNILGMNTSGQWIEIEVWACDMTASGIILHEKHWKMVKISAMKTGGTIQGRAWEWMQVEWQIQTKHLYLFGLLQKYQGVLLSQEKLRIKKHENFNFVVHISKTIYCVYMNIYMFKIFYCWVGAFSGLELHASHNR